GVGGRGREGGKGGGGRWGGVGAGRTRGAEERLLSVRLSFRSEAPGQTAPRLVGPPTSQAYEKNGTCPRESHCPSRAQSLRASRHGRNFSDMGFLLQVGAPALAYT